MTLTKTPSADDGSVVIIGAGPAGLTAAFQLVKRGARPLIVEADEVVGGLSRTAERDGWRFDIGGHRFFTKVKAVEALWREILPDEDFLLRRRMSRIYYRGHFFDYPLRPMNALLGLGVTETFLCMLSYAWARVRPPADLHTFEGWTASRFGWRLYRIFFKTYTEKVWGVPASEIGADWAAQRIKNLSLLAAVWDALSPFKKTHNITSLIEEFLYPKLGPGMMWERCRDRVLERGGRLILGAPVTRIERAAGKAVAVVVTRAGVEERHPASQVISSMPIGQLVAAVDPPAPPSVLAAARGLKHRDHLVVALVVPERCGFPDNWIYVHSPGVRLGRIQNFGAWSPFMVKDGRTCLGLEYFVNEGDAVWSLPDEALVALGTAEMQTLGLLAPSVVQAGYVVRMPKAYPVYDADYQKNLEVVRAFLAAELPNVHPVGRNGMHRYNNQDHSMYTAMLAVENIHGAQHDLWSVNVEEEYLEERRESGDGKGSGRAAPVFRQS